MSRRAAIVEEFDDDTELALPSRALPNTGTHGAILEALSDDEDGDSEPGPATPSYTHFKDPLHALGVGAGMALPGMPKDGAYKKYVLVALGGAGS